MAPRFAPIELEWVRVELCLPAPRLRFTALGHVVRVDPGPMFTGFALRLHAPRLQALQEPDDLDYEAAALSSWWRVANE